MVAADSVSRDAVGKPLCQRCFGEIESVGDSYETAGEIEEARKAGSPLGYPTPKRFGTRRRKSVQRSSGMRARAGGKRIVDRQGLLRTNVRGRYRIVVPRSLVASVL